MNITNKSQTQLDLESIEDSINTATLALQAAAHALNCAYRSTWNLPEERLVNVLQSLADVNQLNSILSLHDQSAHGINAILDAVGSTASRVDTSRPREITVDENGVISLVPLPQPEPEAPIEPEIIPEP